MMCVIMTRLTSDLLESCCPVIQHIRNLTATSLTISRFEGLDDTGHCGLRDSRMCMGVKRDLLARMQVVHYLLGSLPKDLLR